MTDERSPTTGHRRAEPASTPDWRVEWHTGPRAGLRPLFELAEDSPAALDSYLELGRVLVAVSGGRIVGHLQLIEGTQPREAEIKSIAVLPSHQGQGIGRMLIAAAVEVAREEARAVLLVATASAAVDNLRFYQRAGFRMRSVERDAFTVATGYAPDAEVDGIELRDRVWLDLALEAPDQKRE